MLLLRKANLKKCIVIGLKCKLLCCHSNRVVWILLFDVMSCMINVGRKHIHTSVKKVGLFLKTTFAVYIYSQIK